MHNESGVKKIHVPSSKGSDVTINIGGESMILKNRLPILGKEIEFGPFSEEVAGTIVIEINHQ